MQDVHDNVLLILGEIAETVIQRLNKGHARLSPQESHLSRRLGLFLYALQSSYILLQPGEKLLVGRFKDIQLNYTDSFYTSTTCVAAHD